MSPKYIFILIIFLIFLYFSDKYQEIEKMTLSINNQLPNDTIHKLNFIKPGEKVEILDLPYCKKKFKVEYGSNTNYIINDGKKIFQDILKPYEQLAFIDLEQQGLTQISWKKSFFTFNKKPVPLELHFTHQNSKTGKRTRIIFPLSLETKRKENFVDKFSNTINLDKLNILLRKPNDIPNLIKNQVNTGKIMSFNLCESEKYKIEQSKFFIVELPNETLLISKPLKFDKELGLSIMKNLEEPDYDFIKN